MHGSCGEIIGVNVAAEEITERKRAEAALLASEREIRHAKEAAEAALQHLRETQASLIEAEKLAALGRLVAGVAHEINTPVGTSLTIASSLQYKTELFAAEAAQGKLKRSRLNEFVEIGRLASAQLVTNLNRAAELIQSFKQVATDRNYSTRRSFELGDLTEQLATSMRPGLAKKNLTLSVDCQSGLMMDSFPGPYGQVLTNLFLNAVSHAFPAGRPGAMRIEARAHDKDNVEITFYDDGCGMSEDIRRKAFDPFFTSRRDQGSSGLGLHIVHSIVTSHLGGRIALESAPDAGTRIRIVLPRGAPAAAPVR
jgi:signal transduction histidine kinase